MQELIKHLATVRTQPRLWFERLVIFREPDSAHFIRSIPFVPGLNLVWAKEPAPGSATGIHAAGHSVGKTSLCLLLRWCLGDTAKAVVGLRDELHSVFPKGGVAAILFLDEKPFTVCRFFNSHREGHALAGSDVELLLQKGDHLTYAEFEQVLTDTLMSNVSPRYIPDTGQPIEWRHLLAWLARDQGSRFKSFFDWREGEGTGLHRLRQDPPVVVRAILGLLGQDESGLIENLSNLARDLEATRQETIRLQQEPTLIRKRIESELRDTLGLDDNVPLRSDDLFEASVEQVVKEADKKVTERLETLDAENTVANQAWIAIAAELKALEKQYETINAEYELADAARRNDEVAYRAITERLLKLKELTGWCDPGHTPFQKCQHIQNEINRLQATDMKDSRDKSALQQSMSISAAQVGEALRRKKQLDGQLEILRQSVSEADKACRKIRFTRDSAAIDIDRRKRISEELDRWERTSGSNEARVAIDQSVSKGAEIQLTIDNANTRLQVLQVERSSRQKHLDKIIEYLARELLSNEAFGTFDPRDEFRPFKLSIRGGEAYHVMEVLLGDLVCLLDSAGANSAFPGLVIHDCPREADMSAGLYEKYLLLVERIQYVCFNKNVPYQYIVTTTTPPPHDLIKGECLRLVLDPSKDDELLFRQRFIQPQTALV